MSKERTISGIKVVVSGETYDEYKGTLQEQLEEKDKEIERLKDLVKQLWNNNKSSNLNEEQKELLNSTIFGSDKE